MLWHEIGIFVRASGGGRGEVCGSCKKFSRGKKEAEREMRLLRARGSDR